MTAPQLAERLLAQNIKVSAIGVIPKVTDRQLVTFHEVAGPVF